MIKDQEASIYGCLVQRRSDQKFLYKKDLFYPDSAKIDMVKITFHVLFLVLETTERRK